MNYGTLIIILSLVTFSLCIQNKQYGRFYRHDVCEEEPNSPVKWEYCGVDNSHPTYSSINAKCNITRLVKTASIAAVITRCEKRDNLDSCEPYTTIKPTDTCSFIALKGMAWSTYIHAFKPPFICPFKPGTYVQKNGTLDPNIFNFFPIHGWYWKVQFKIYEGQKFLFTFCSEFAVVKIS